MLANRITSSSLQTTIQDVTDGKVLEKKEQV